MSDERYEGYDRVTDCLYMFSGMDKINPDVLKNAADRGTHIHSICDAIIEGMGYNDIGVEGYIDSFKQWYEGKEFIEKPKRWFCDVLKITGETDGLYKNETGLTLVDFKTPARESKTWKLQGSAYYHLGCKAALHITKIEFVRLKKDGKSPQVYLYEPDIESYKMCLNVYRMFYKKADQLTELDYI